MKEWLKKEQQLDGASLSWLDNRTTGTRYGRGPSYGKKQRGPVKRAQAAETIRLIKFHGTGPVLTSVEVCMRAQVLSEVSDRPGSPNIPGSRGVRLWEVAARVCRLMDSGARPRDWLQCTSIGLCVPRRITTRNIISTDWHFAFASINIARGARGISNSPRTWYRVRVLYELRVTPSPTVFRREIHPVARFR